MALKCGDTIDVIDRLDAWCMRVLKQQRMMKTKHQITDHYAVGASPTVHRHVTVTAEYVEYTTDEPTEGDTVLVLITQKPVKYILLAKVRGVDTRANA